jgi:uncharacterized membrane protein YhaH (DUF805 family)
MIASIAYNLKRILHFKGRDGRKLFWNYFLFIVLLNFAVMFAAAIPTFATVISEATAVANSGDQAIIEAAALDSMMNLGLPGTLVRTGLLLGLLNIVLLAASLVRRAHDSGLPGLVLIIPLGLQIIWMYFSYGQLEGLGTTMRAAVETTQAGGEPQMQVGMIAQDLIGWLAVLIVVAIGIIKSQLSPNQYADEPHSL